MRTKRDYLLIMHSFYALCAENVQKVFYAVNSGNVTVSMKHAKT